MYLVDLYIPGRSTVRRTRRRSPWLGCVRYAQDIMLLAAPCCFVGFTSWRALPVLCAAAATAPSKTLSPAAVVEAQLAALQQDDVESCYQFASPENRRNIGPWQNLNVMVRSMPGYSDLLGCSGFEILSALSMGSRRWTCRVRVQPSEASLRCMDRAATVEVGQRVRLTGDVMHIARQFDTVGYQWSDEMIPMAGNEFEVLCLARENRNTAIVGLPSPDGSQDGIWYFPTTVLELTDGSADSKQNDDRTREFRWELSLQSSNAPKFDLGQLIAHREYGYRGVIVGYDASCQQSEEWMESMGVDSLPGGREQTFYHVLVDARDRAGDQVTYVAEVNAIRPNEDATSLPIRHRLVETMLQSETFDGSRHTYEPVPELKTLYPAGVQGCWMVDGVLPDDTPAVAAEE